MTPDVDAIRAALAAATPAPWEIAETGLDEFDRPFHRIGRPEMSIEDDIAQVWSDNKADDEFAANGALVANAPVWLASLCDEIEWLRSDGGFGQVIKQLVAEKDDARALVTRYLLEIERLRAEQNTDRESKGDAPDRITLLVAERNAALAEVELVRLTAFTLEGQRDAALAECERLRAIVESKSEHIGETDEFIEGIVADQAAWRACADQLADKLRWYAERSSYPEEATDVLAVYKSLKAQR